MSAQMHVFCITWERDDISLRHVVMNLRATMLWRYVPETWVVWSKLVYQPTLGNVGWNVFGVAMFLASCVVCNVGVRVTVWTFYLEHIKLDVVYWLVLTTWTWRMTQIASLLNVLTLNKYSDWCSLVVLQYYMYVYNCVFKQKMKAFACVYKTKVFITISMCVCFEWVECILGS